MKIFRLLVLTLLFLLFVNLPVLAASKITVGTACVGDANAFDWDAAYQCVGNVWVRAPVHVGTSLDTCDAAKKGQIQWTGTAFQGCDGTSWTSLGGGSGAGITGHQVVTQACGANVVCTATCPAGKKILGGGCWLQAAFAHESGPIYTDAYSCFSPSTQTTAYAVCANGSTGAGGIFLGATATDTNPQRSGESGTGLFSDTASTISIATDGVQRLFVSATGSVGIGTQTPAKTLDVLGDARIKSTSYLTTFTGTGGDSLLIGGGVQTGQYAKIAFGNGNTYGAIGLRVDGSGSAMSFGTSNNYTSGITNEAMTIDKDGYVSVTATPTAAGHLTNKAYVDSVAGGGGGSCPTVTAGSATFTANGTFNPASYGLAPTTSCPVKLRVLLIGGGGSGGAGLGTSAGNQATGGGGGSGFVYASPYWILSSDIIPAVVGKGGVVSTMSGSAYYTQSAASGTPSSFGTMMALGGEAGGVGDAYYNGGDFFLMPGVGGNGGTGGGGGWAQTGTPSSSNGAAGGTNGGNGAAQTNSGGYGQGTIVNSTTSILGLTFSSATFAAQAAIAGQSNRRAGGGAGITVKGTTYGTGGNGGTTSAANYNATNGTAGVIYVEW